MHADKRLSCETNKYPLSRFTANKLKTAQRGGGVLRGNGEKSGEEV